MAAIDYASIPESTRQSLLAATYKAAQRYFQDPAAEARFQTWLAKRKAAQQAAERKEEQSAIEKKPLPDVQDREAAKGGQPANDYPRELYHDDGHLSNGGISWVTG